MYELMQTNILDSSNKEFEVNRLLAGIAARYLALYEVYGDEKTFMDEALDSRTINLLQSYGFLQMYPNISSLLASTKDTEILLKSNDSGAESDKSLLQKINLIYKKLLTPKSNRFKLFQSCLEKIYLRCYTPNSQKVSSVNYSQSDLQILIDIVSTLIPKHIKEYQDQKDYNDRVKAFGKRLNAIKNNTTDSKSDHMVLLAIVGEFKKHNFVLDSKFKAAVVDNRIDFADVNRFLSQKRVLATLFAINVEVIGLDFGYGNALEALNIIGAINNKPKSVLNKSDITADISRQAHLFINSCDKSAPKSLPEIIKDIIVQGRILAQQAFSACKYLIVGVDISLISLSLVAGLSVFIANSVLILSISVVAILAFIADAGCCNIDKVSNKFYDSYLNLYNRILDRDSKTHELIISSDGSIHFDPPLKTGSFQQQGSLVGAMGKTKPWAASDFKIKVGL